VPLDGLVILNAPHPARFRQALKTWDQRRRSWYMAFFQIPWLPEFLLTRGEGRPLMRDLKRQSPNWPGELLGTMRRNVVTPGAATAMLAYYRANMRRLTADEGQTATIECPTLLIWGEDDLYLSPTLASGNEVFVANLTVRRLPGVSHWVQQDAPDRINGEIGQWARGHALQTA
jgi:pimeloyl-ACP methyl ester carboxylesterase